MGRKSEDPENTPSLVPSLTLGLAAGLFDNLTLLSLSECWIDPHPLARLLGPGRPARQHMKDLSHIFRTGYWSKEPVALFLLEALEYLDREHYARALVVDPRTLAEAEPDWDERVKVAEERFEPSCEHSTATGTAAQIALAHTDYPSFLQLFRDFDDVHLILGTSHKDFAQQVFLAASSAPSPFVNLVTLSMQYMAHEELFLIFFTPSFPALKELTLWAVEEPSVRLTPELHGAMRFSITHDPPGQIIPPEEPAYNFVVPDDYQGQFDPVWTPLAEKEVAFYALQPYR